jgi:hypothetical protein
VSPIKLKVACRLAARLPGHLKTAMAPVSAEVFVSFLVQGGSIASSSALVYAAPACCDGSHSARGRMPETDDDDDDDYDCAPAA